MVSGSEDAFAEIYRRHAATVRSVARMILGAVATCDDVVAEVFVGLWVSPVSFDPARGTLRSFLRLQARSRSLDVWRSETARRRREETQERYAGQIPRGIDAEFLAAEQATSVRRAVELLPPTERDAVRLAFFGGMSYRGVAALLGLPEGTTKSRIRSGLRRLAAMDALVEQHHERVPQSVVGASMATARFRAAAGA
jgi:RNA polymerase sigma-70 factor (ECF subfamily)